ncbi:D-alanine--D-alanine ligase B [Candidatus Providencia siddallii]|uniref:D-alanine--D-alanine ligase n=1 Tax=Candidatus Providencia siddallii TaxID=1715285 RepID=A0A0M6W6K6_9GAMM|nr:D-alanine--D-alanine ligase B [Candidatus Providencia siddallii]
MAEKIAVLLGGVSAEREISLKSGNVVLNTLRQLGINAHPVDTKYFPLLKIKNKGFNKAFIALHGIGGEDGTIQGMLEILNLPYTGSGVMASSISIDKLRTKQLWKGAGLVVSPYIFLTKNEYTTTTDINLFKQIKQFGLPLIVKPSTEGSSIGISKINNLNMLKAAIDLAFYYSDTLLIEKWLYGPEYTVTVLNGVALPAICILPSGNFYDYNSKYKSNNTQYLCPSGLKKELEFELSDIAIKAYNVIGCRGCARVDIIQDKNKQFYLLEINTSPGMTKKSLAPMAAAKAGFSFSELIMRILELAI